MEVISLKIADLLTNPDSRRLPTNPDLEKEQVRNSVI
jgi:hypothetical protein